jgi:hypothetical protein
MNSKTLSLLNQMDSSLLKSNVNKIYNFKKIQNFDKKLKTYKFTHFEFYLNNFNYILYKILILKIFFFSLKVIF